MTTEDTNDRFKAALSAEQRQEAQRWITSIGDADLKLRYKWDANWEEAYHHARLVVEDRKASDTGYGLKFASASTLPTVIPLKSLPISVLRRFDTVVEAKKWSPSVATFYRSLDGMTYECRFSGVLSWTWLPVSILHTL